MMTDDNAALIGRWLEWQAACGLRPDTLRTRREFLTVFTRSHDLRTATRDDVTTFLARIKGGAWSRRGYLGALRSYYRWAVLAGEAATNPTDGVPLGRVPRGYPRPVPEHVLAAALAHADERVRLMLLLGAYAGLRRTEIATLHSDNVSETHLTITGKGGVTRVIPVHPILRPHLTFKGWAFPGPDGHLAPHRISELVGRALGAPWTTHTLRHRAASRAYAGSHDLRAVQEFLGHRSPTTTALYVATDMDALTAAVLAIA